MNTNNNQEIRVQIRQFIETLLEGEISSRDWEMLTQYLREKIAQHLGTRDQLAAAAHDAYLQTARRLGWPIRPEVNVPFDQLSQDAKTLDYAFADLILAKLRTAL